MNSARPGLEKMGGCFFIPVTIKASPPGEGNNCCCPSAAVAFAVMLTRRSAVNGQKVGLIVSGGNADLDNLPWISCFNI